MNSSSFIGAQSARRVATVLGVSLLAAGTAFGQDPPASVDLPVVIRDFSKTHADFAVVPADGYAYYAGNVAFDLDADGKPVFTGGGFKAQRLWKNIDGKPIAPHLYNTCEFLTPIGGSSSGGAGFALTVDEKVEVENRSVIDSFDSSLGPYGGENVGVSAFVRVNGPAVEQEQQDSKHKRGWWWGRKHSRKSDPDHAVEVSRRATIKGDVMVGPDLDLENAVKLSKKGEITGTVGQLEAAVDIPVALEPEFGPSTGDVKYRGGERTISEDLHCDDLELRKRAVVNIEGDVTILVDDDLKMHERSEIRLMDGATLTLYVGDRVEVKRGSKINMNTGNPQLVSILMLGGTAEPAPESAGAESSPDARGEDCFKGGWDKGRWDKGRWDKGRWDRGGWGSKSSRPDTESKIELDRGARMVAWVQGADATHMV
jgi:hypothetical protein